MDTADPVQRKESGSPKEIRQHLRRLDRKDAWFWWNAVLVITALAGAIVAMSLPARFDSDLFFGSDLSIAVRGLLGLVLIFNIYTLYQQHLLRELRRRLADEIESSTAQKIRAETLYEMAILDPLTGLYNRRYSEERLKSELDRAQRFGLPLIVLAFDLDRFKEINDRFGHDAGDRVLKEFAYKLKEGSRGSDFAVRLGGDEFLLVLPDCPPQNVKLVLSRLAPMDFEFSGEKIKVVSSYGWVQSRGGESLAELLKRVDEALYRDKESSRSEILKKDDVFAGLPGMSSA